MAEYDLIIRNGHVVDGSGGKSGILDVAVKDGLIQAVGENLPDTALIEIDAAGLIVTPGFVDVHTHYDGQATWDSHLILLLILAQPQWSWATAAWGLHPANRKIATS